MVVEWRHVIYAEEWHTRLLRIAEKRFRDPGLAEEACTAGQAHLSEQLAAYGRDQEPSAALVITIFNRAVEDFARARFGRVRPPVWIKRLGGIWERVFNLLCLERQPTEAIVLQLCGDVVDAPCARQVRDAVRQIKGKLPRCGEKLTELRGGPDGRDPLQNLSGEEPYSHADPETLMEHRELNMLFQVLGNLLHDTKKVGEREATELSDRVARRWGELRAALKLEDDERLVLRLLYQEGKTVAQAARDLGEKEHTVMRRRNRVLKRIRGVFEHLGVGAEDIRGLKAG